MHLLAFSNNALYHEGRLGYNRKFTSQHLPPGVKPGLQVRGVNRLVSVGEPKHTKRSVVKAALLALLLFSLGMMRGSPDIHAVAPPPVAQRHNPANKGSGAPSMCLWDAISVPFTGEVV